jgi:hypothetical protein
VEHFHCFRQILCILQNSAIMARFLFLIPRTRRQVNHQSPKVKDKQNQTIQKIREKMKKYAVVLLKSVHITIRCDF